MLILSGSIYLVVGICFAVIGPIARSISEQVKNLRGSDLANAITGREKVPESKLVAFRVVLSAVTAFLWPIFLYSVLRENAETAKEQRDWERRVASGLEFSRLGGAGAIHCRTCGFEQDVTSFTHGYTEDGERCCDQGCQCLSCGKIVSVHGVGEPARFAVVGCECGGELSRDHLLFCPKCRSKDLRYDMHYIT